jgi:hypothetical protein
VVGRGLLVGGAVGRVVGRGLLVSTSLDRFLDWFDGAITVFAVAVAHSVGGVMCDRIWKRSDALGQNCDWLSKN